MTILEIKSAAAALLSDAGAPVAVADFTVGGQDMALLLLNQIRLNAELANDFNFQRKLLTLNVDTVTGGSLPDAVLYGTATTVDLKTIIDIGEFDTNLNLRPIEWTTVEESLERQRDENPYYGLRYPTDGQIEAWPSGQRRLTVANDKIYSWPKTEAPSQTLAIGVEAYVFSAEWSTASNTVVVTNGTGVTTINTTYYRHGMYNSFPLFVNLSNTSTPATLYYIWNSGTAWNINTLPGTVGANYHSFISTSQSPAGSYVGHGTFTGTALAAASETDTTSDIWTTKGQQYLLWQLVVELNYRFKFYVPRTEGNLASPTQLAAEGLEKLIQWDIYKFEGHRRHGR